jgi:hypothetical protein
MGRTKADSTLGLQVDLLPQVWRILPQIGKDLLRFAVAINIGVIEEINARIQRRSYTAYGCIMN